MYFAQEFKRSFLGRICRLLFITKNRRTQTLFVVEKAERNFFVKYIGKCSKMLYNKISISLKGNETYGLS